jgi:hypothetical protein
MKYFKDDLNTAVFTTRFVLQERSPILHIFHDDDGYWQFIGAETEIKTEDYKIVSLGEIIELDPTVQELADLPYAWEAWRESVGSEWVKKSQNSNADE